MKRQDKKLFDKRFKIFWERLTKKKKMNDEQKNHYQKTMLNHFKELRKNLDEHTSLFYVFHIPFSVVIFNERNQLRRSKDNYADQNYLAVITYFLQNEVSEYAACKFVFANEKLSYKNLNTFIRMFRKWYQDIWNKDSFPQIDDYLIKLKFLNSLRKLPSKQAHSKQKN